MPGFFGSEIPGTTGSQDFGVTPAAQGCQEAITRAKIGNMQSKTIIAVTLGTLLVVAVTFVATSTNTSTPSADANTVQLSSPVTGLAAKTGETCRCATICYTNDADWSFCFVTDKNCKPLNGGDVWTTFRQDMKDKLTSLKHAAYCTDVPEVLSHCCVIVIPRALVVFARAFCLSVFLIDSTPRN